MRYWLQAVFGLLISMLTFAYKSLANKVKEQGAIKLGIQALLRDRIIDTYNYYCDKGFFPIYARENIEQLYVQYHALGGNGTMTELTEKLRDLPTEKYDY
jgi:hypothetical protein